MEKNGFPLFITSRNLQIFIGFFGIVELIAQMERIDYGRTLELISDNHSDMHGELGGNSKSSIYTFV